MSVANWINSRERQDVDGKDAGECFLDVCGSVLDLAWIDYDAPGRRCLHCHTALSFRNANSTMRNSLHPSRDREICVS